MKKLQFIIGAIALVTVLGLNVRHALDGYVSNVLWAEGTTSTTTTSACTCASKFSPAYYAIHYVDALKTFNFLVQGNFKAGAKIMVPIPGTTIKVTVEIPFNINGSATITVPYRGCDTSFCPNVCKKLVYGT